MVAPPFLSWRTASGCCRSRFPVRTSGSTETTDGSSDPGARFIYDEGPNIPFPIQLDDTLWQSRLESFEYYVLREKGTEYAFSDPMHPSKEAGIYYSRATGQPLFSSEDKFDSGTGRRYCMNATSLIFVPDGEEPPPLIQELRALAATAGE